LPNVFEKYAQNKINEERNLDFSYTNKRITLVIFKLTAEKF
jgi:hypothetical protein